MRVTRPNPNRQRGGRAVWESTARENFVYWIYDDAGHVLYIGCTRCPEKRWNMHAIHNPRLWAAASKCRMRGPYTRKVALQIERAAILDTRPPFNRQVWKVASPAELSA